MVTEGAAHAAGCIGASGDALPVGVTEQTDIRLISEPEHAEPVSRGKTSSRKVIEIPDLNDTDAMMKLYNIKDDE